jgi:AcrR family transcriptional regulator
MLRRAHDLAELHRPGPDSRQAHDHILDVAEQLFADDGFDATSMRDVAQAAGVNVATLYYHCGSKQQLFDAIFERVLDRMTAFVGETSTSGGDFNALAVSLLDRVVEFFARHPSVPRLLERAELGESSGVRSRRKGQKTLLDSVAAELRRRAALGQIRAVEPTPFMHAAAGVIFHLTIGATKKLEGSKAPVIDDRTLATLQTHARMYILGALGLDPRTDGQPKKKGNSRGDSRREAR